MVRLLAAQKYMKCAMLLICVLLWVLVNLCKSQSSIAFHAVQEHFQQQKNDQMKNLYLYMYTDNSILNWLRQKAEYGISHVNTLLCLS